MCPFRHSIQPRTLSLLLVAIHHLLLGERNAMAIRPSAAIAEHDLGVRGKL